MADVSARWNLPLIVPGQAQKEMTHNEALAVVDLLLQTTVVAAGIDVPPVEPAEGACWIVGDAPTGAWAGAERALAGWTKGGWRFVAPREGMCAWNAGAARTLRFRDGAWAEEVLSGESLRLGGETILAPRAAGIADPAGGAVIDEQARIALSAIIDVLQHHRLIA
jgi:hypothetical protein